MRLQDFEIYHACSTRINVHRVYKSEWALENLLLKKSLVESQMALTQLLKLMSCRNITEEQ